MAHSAIIQSSYDGTTLELFNRNGDYFCAHITGPTLQCTASIYAYEPKHLKAFFLDLAANSWKGWAGKKEWVSVEGEFSLSAVIDSTGHISLSVRMRSGGYPFDWSLATVLLVESGQLNEIASSIGIFVDG